MRVLCWIYFSVSFAVAIGAFVGFLWTAASLGVPELLDVKLTTAGCQELLSRLKEEPRTNHIWLTTVWDSIFPLVYGNAMVSALLVTRSPRIVLIVPLVALLSDYSENYLQLVMLHEKDVKALSSTLLVAKCVATWIKFASVLFGTIVAVWYGWREWKRWRSASA